MKRERASANSMRGYDLSVEGRPRIRVLDDASALAQAAARMIVEAADEAVAARGRFIIALAGGATPRDTYSQLARSPLRDAMPWADTWVFFGDERAVSIEHAESNYRMAHATLLSLVPLPLAQVFRMGGEAEDQEAAATEYIAALRRVFATKRGELPRFDMVLLGLGVDGHTASLFPYSAALKETVRWVVSVHAGAAAIPARLTMTLPVLNAARRVMFLAAGSEKAKVIRAVLQDGARVPARMVYPAEGTLDWLLDRPAASNLEPRRPWRADPDWI
ncbi:MAG: 6-phosphogluconolactonase [Candidatus Rokuibacteriota bacterium]